MAKTVHQLVYISKATRKYSETELFRLCEKSSAFNYQSGVTGLLLYDGFRFIQALEGEEPAVRNVMARVLKDGGHKDVDIFSEKTVDDRHFGNWSMDHKTAKAGCCSREFLDKVKDDVAIIDDVELRAAFIGFAVLGTGVSHPGYRCTAG